jgi:hypothetical protein
VSAAASPVWNCVGTLRVFISGVQKTTCLASSEPSCSDSAVRKLQTFNAERRTKILRFFFSTEGAPFGLTLLLGNKTGRTADVDLKTNLHVKMRRDTAGKEPAEGERGCHKLTLFFFFLQFRDRWVPLQRRFPCSSSSTARHRLRDHLQAVFGLTLLGSVCQRHAVSYAAAYRLHRRTLCLPQLDGKASKKKKKILCRRCRAITS